MQCPDTPPFSYGGFWLRFVGYLIDSVVVAIPAGLTGACGGLVMSSFMGERTLSNLYLGALIVGYFLAIAAIWLYFTLMESSSRQGTLGKMALGLVVTDMNGNRISWGKANARYWSKYISSLILMIGYIMAGFTEKKQALHDMIAGTLVMRK